MREQANAWNGPGRSQDLCQPSSSTAFWIIWWLSWMPCRIFSHVMAPSSTDLPLISSSSSASSAAFRGEAWPEHRTGISFWEATWFCCWSCSSSSLCLGWVSSRHCGYRGSPANPEYTSGASGQVGFLTLLWRDAGLLCYAWLVFLSMYLLKMYIERNFFPEAQVQCWIVLNASTSLISLT